MNTDLLYCLDTAAATVSLFSVFLLFFRAEGIRARKILGGILLVWGIIYLITFFRIGQIEEMAQRGFMPPFGLIFGTVGSGSMLFYVVEVMRSGWLTWKRVLLILTPFFISVAIFLGVMAWGDIPVYQLEKPADFLVHIGEFNVWYRLVFLLITLFYVASMFFVFIRYAPGYRKWADENYSSPELMDISWLRFLLWGIVCITVIYLYAMASETIMPLYIHFSFIIVFFPYLAYKGLFLRNPYPERFFKVSLEDEKYDQAVNEDNESPFAMRMEEYRSLFEEWMEKEKPYLHTDFKLADVSARYPMNRTYLARFFSETYGCSFSNLVRRYRVEEAKRILQENPSLIAKELYPQCGFTSEVVFHRAFTEETGITPKNYRLSL